MVHEEMAWVDDQAPSERLYWFPGLFPETWQVLESKCKDSYCLHAEEVLQTVDWQSWRIHKLILTKSCETMFKKLAKMVSRHRQCWREALLRELDSNTQEGIAKKRLDEQNNPYVRVFTCCSCPLQNNAICPNFEYLMQNFEPCSLGWINMQHRSFGLSDF